MCLFEPLVFHFDEGFDGEIVLVDGWHLKVHIFLIDVPVFIEVGFGGVVFDCFVGFDVGNCWQCDFVLDFLFLH